MKIKPLLWALSPFAAGALLWLTLGAAADLENVYFPSVRVAHTNYVNELISSNGITLGGVRNTAWPAGGGSAPVGTVINTNSGTAGMPLVLSGTNPTNTVPSWGMWIPYNDNGSTNVFHTTNSLSSSSITNTSNILAANGAGNNLVSFGGSDGITAIGTDALEGATLDGGHEIVAMWDIAMQHANIKNSYDISALGDFALGYAGITNCADLNAIFGDAMSQANFYNVADSTGLGSLALEQATGFNSSSINAAFFEALYQAYFTNTTHVTAISDESLRNSILDGSKDIMALQGALQYAKLTNSQNVVGIGKFAGHVPGSGTSSGLTGSLTNIVLLGKDSYAPDGTSDKVILGNGMSMNVSGPVLSTSSTTNGPSANELATAGWVRNLLVTGQILYNSGDTNASGFDNPTYAYVSTIPTNGSRTYLSAVCTNNAYIGSVMTTNTYQSIGGDIVISPYICSINGTPSSGYTMHGEVYLTYDRTNIFGDYESGVENIYHGVTNKYSFVVPVPQYTSTNSTGFYIVRRLKVNVKTGSDDIVLHYGTNFPSSISIPGQNAAGANWIASGAQDSTLNGTATVGSLIVNSNASTASLLVTNTPTGSFPMLVNGDYATPPMTIVNANSLRNIRQKLYSFKTGRSDLFQSTRILLMGHSWVESTNWSCAFANMIEDFVGSTNIAGAGNCGPGQNTVIAAYDSAGSAFPLKIRPYGNVQATLQRNASTYSYFGPGYWYQFATNYCKFQVDEMPNQLNLLWITREPASSNTNCIWSCYYNDDSAGSPAGQVAMYGTTSGYLPQVTALTNIPVSAPFTLTISNIGSGAINGFLGSVEHIKTNTGVRIYKWGIAGTTATNFFWPTTNITQAAATANFTNIVGHASPDLVVMEFDTNEQSTQQSLDAYEYALTNLITNIRLAKNGQYPTKTSAVDIIFLSSASIGLYETNTLKTIDYNRVCAKVANQNNCAFINMQNEWGANTNNYINSSQSAFLDATSHPSQKGGSSIAAMVFRALVQ